MGEMADYTNESGWVDTEWSGRARAIECVFCGARPLEWKRTTGGWRLYAGDAIHQCQAYAQAKQVKQ